VIVTLSIVRDGWRNLHHATTGLMDQRARTYDDLAPHPLTREVDEVRRGRDAGTRPAGHPPVVDGLLSQYG
jgi:divalent metal cation (Fe/Co/Zn/Cd) transporter